MMHCIHQLIQKYSQQIVKGRLIKQQLLFRLYLIVLIQEFAFSQQLISSRPTRPTRSPTLISLPNLTPRRIRSTTPPSDLPVFITIQPTNVLMPSEIPSISPSVLNTSSESVSGLFGQKFVRPKNDTFLANDDEQSFLGVVQGYTENFAPKVSYPNVTTTCSVRSQTIEQVENQTTLNLEYECMYQSNDTDVSNFTVRYVQYVNANLTAFAADLREGGVSVLKADRVVEIKSRQTISPAPTGLPLSSPTVATFFPTQNNDPLIPSAAPVTKEKVRRLSVFTIAAIVVSGGLSVLAMLVCYYVSWKRKHLVLDDFTNDAQSVEANDVVRTPQRTNGIWTRQNTDESHPQPVLSPTDSFMTNKSLLSTGDPDLADESFDEYDGTNDLQDEFDQYRNRNVELFRAEVEEKVTGMEGVMSAAVTMAHMIDDKAAPEKNELRWGCDEKCCGVDIEASALYEVSDWLKRNENTPPERRRAFMEEILNRMVSSVKNGVLNADDGSRTIHEAAAVLGLQLAEGLPMATVVISGMRLQTTKDDLAAALREFGDIDIAAVAPGFKGFGIVRFRRPKSVDRAMQRYNTGEIVIDDVAVQMKVLMATSLIDSRAPDIPD